MKSWIFFQVPGGRLSEIHGTKRVLGIAMLLSAILTLASVPATYLDVYALIAARVAIGLAQGVLIPSINPMLLKYDIELISVLH